MKIAVTGAGGFIGGHLVNHLGAQGHHVIAIDVKPYEAWYQHPAELTKCYDHFDLRYVNPNDLAAIVHGCDQVYALAADMGGMGYIEYHKLACSLNVLTSANTMFGSEIGGVGKMFYASSACVYNADKQATVEAKPLKESDAYPAMPEDGYGWEKLYSERLATHFDRESQMQTRVARYHNVYGPKGAWQGGREKAPAALCRKVIECHMNGEDDIHIWGDGQQTRSFMYIDDCIDGTMKIMNMRQHQILNLGSSELVSINQLLDIIEEIAGFPRLNRRYNFEAPTGVRGRNSDNTNIKTELNWEPRISLYEGLEATYAWIRDEMS